MTTPSAVSQTDAKAITAELPQALPAATAPARAAFGARRLPSKARLRSILSFAFVVVVSAAGVVAIGNAKRWAASVDPMYISAAVDAAGSVRVGVGIRRAVHAQTGVYCLELETYAFSYLPDLIQRLESRVLSSSAGDTVTVNTGDSPWCKSTEIEYRTFSVGPDGVQRAADLGVIIETR